MDVAVSQVVGQSRTEVAARAGVEPDAAPIVENAAPARRPLFVPDAGWLFLIAGVGILAATLIIPAQHDLDLARWQRDRAVAIEKHRMDRLERYGTYLAAVERADECVVMSLAASQLNKSPVDRIPLDARPDPGLTSASVYPALEPPPIELPPKPGVSERSSLLARWTIADHTRLWLLAGGMLCVLIGVLPPSTRPAPAK